MQKRTLVLECLPVPQKACNKIIGTLSKDDDDVSEYVAKKMNLRSFKLNRAYLDQLNM